MAGRLRCKGSAAAVLHGQAWLHVHTCDMCVGVEGVLCAVLVQLRGGNKFCVRGSCHNTTTPVMGEFMSGWPRLQDVSGCACVLCSWFALRAGHQSACLLLLVVLPRASLRLLPPRNILSTALHVCALLYAAMRWQQKSTQAYGAAPPSCVVTLHTVVGARLSVLAPRSFWDTRHRPRS